MERRRKSNRRITREVVLLLIMATCITFLWKWLAPQALSGVAFPKSLTFALLLRLWMYRPAPPLRSPTKDH